MFDQSGSVDDESLGLLFGELGQLAKRTTFDVYYFDTEVDVENKFTWKKGSRVSPKRTRCGGTNFEAPTKHAHSMMDKYDGYMILTDGYAPKPSPSRMRRVWIVTPDGGMDFDKGRDVAIQMSGNKKKAS